MITSHNLYKHSSESMPELEDNSIHLSVTSPPYNANKAYGQSDRLNPNGQKITREKNSDSKPWDQYVKLHRQVTSEVFRVLVPGGRFCINVSDLGRYKKEGDLEFRLIPLSILWWSIATQVGFIYEGKFIWKKTNGSNSLANGSYQTYTRPIIQDIHEEILVFAKPPAIMEKNQDHPRFTISAEEYHKIKRSIWEFKTKSHSVHPAVFPKDIPERLIKFYSGPGHTILDPFAGSGTAAEVAKQLGRHSISYEIEELYWPLIEETTLQTSIDNWFSQQPDPSAAIQEN